jgi:hypothetical protein
MNQRRSSKSLLCRVRKCLRKLMKTFRGEDQIFLLSPNWTDLYKYERSASSRICTARSLGPVTTPNKASS